MNLYKSYKTSRYLLYEPIACMIPWNYMLRNLILSNLSKFIILYWNATGKIKTHLNQKWQHQSKFEAPFQYILKHHLWETARCQRRVKIHFYSKSISFCKTCPAFATKIMLIDTILKINTYSKRQVCGKKYRNYTYVVCSSAKYFCT